MIFDFSLKSSLLLVFFFHGLVFTLLLLVKGIRDNDRPSLWLSLFTFLCTLYITPFMMGYAGWYSINPYRDFLFYVPFQQLFLIPPVLYFYCATLFDRSFVFTKQHAFHFLPALIYLLYSLMVFVVDVVILGEPYFYADGRDKDFTFEYQFLGYISLLVYLVLSIRLYRRYKDITYNTVSYADSVTFHWAQRFLIAFGVLLFMRGLFFVLNPEFDQFGRKFWYYLVFSILFYYISISGYVNSLRSVAWFQRPSEPKLSADKLATDELNQGKSFIEALMENRRMYEHPELSVEDVARELGTHPKKVSQIINQGFGMNFNDYINKHRVEAVVRKLRSGRHTEHTLLGIALDCGFNSKSTFNRAFKRQMKVTPKAYIQIMAT